MLMDVTAIGSLVTAITSALSTDAFLTPLGTLFPAIAGVLIFAFIYRVVRRMVSGASKGKARI